MLDRRLASAHFILAVVVMLWSSGKAFSVDVATEVMRTSLGCHMQGWRRWFTNDTSQVNMRPRIQIPSTHRQAGWSIRHLWFGAGSVKTDLLGLKIARAGLISDLQIQREPLPKNIKERKILDASLWPRCVLTLLSLPVIVKVVNF